MVRFALFRVIAVVVWGALILFGASCADDEESESQRGVSLADRIEMLEDPEGVRSFDEVASPASDGLFRPRKGPANLGITRSIFWFRLDVAARDFTGDPRRAVVSLGSHFDEAVAYAKSASEGGDPWQKLALADFARKGTAPAAFELPPYGGGTVRLLVRVRTFDTLVFAPRLEDVSEYVERNDAESLRKGVYYGILIGAITYNLFLAIWLRDRSYALYVVFEAAFCATVACMDRTIVTVFPAMMGALRHGLSERLMNVTGIVAVLFARDFLDLRESPRIRIGAIGALVFGVALLSLPESLDRQTLYTTAYLFIIYTTSLVSFMIFLSWRKGNANAGLFLVAWGAVLVATTLGSLANLGVLMPSYSVIDSLRAGSAVEAMLLAVALARRMNRIKEAEEAARSELAEARLRLSKMLQRQVSSLNTLVGGVAHEIGNPLNFATGGARDVVGRIRTAEQIASEIAGLVTSNQADSLRDVLAAARRSAALAARGTERIDGIVKNLRTYVGAGAHAMESTNLDDCIRSTVSLLETHLHARGINVVLDLGLTSEVRCSPSEINQVFMNLVLNASQAMSEGGQITVRSEELAESVRVVISDTGPGVPEALRQSIFDPFFTTRAPNQGTGLGLAVSTEIARRHGGRLELLARTDGQRGAAFAITLPRSH